MRYIFRTRVFCHVLSPLYFSERLLYLFSLFLRVSKKRNCFCLYMLFVRCIDHLAPIKEIPPKKLEIAFEFIWETFWSNWSASVTGIIRLKCFKLIRIEKTKLLLSSGPSLLNLGRNYTFLNFPTIEMIFSPEQQLLMQISSLISDFQSSFTLRITSNNVLAFFLPICEL